MILKFSALTALLICFLGELVWARPPISGTRYEHLSGVRKVAPRMGESSDIAFQQSEGGHPRTSRFLIKNHEYIPLGAHILEVGMGPGHNAVFLARKGHSVVGLETNGANITQAQELAMDFDVRINAVASTFDEYASRETLFDVIVVMDVFDPNKIEKWLDALVPGGLFIIEAYTNQQKKLPSFESQESHYYTRRGELLEMFSDLVLLKYEEPLHLNEFKASAIFKKPKDQQRAFEINEEDK